MIVDWALYRCGVRQEAGGGFQDALTTARTDDQAFVWVGLYEPSHEELTTVSTQFGLHSLAVEDAVKAHQRPKVEEYEDSLFVVLKTVRYDEGTQQVELGDVMLFVGDSFVVSVRHGEGRALSDVRRGLEMRQEVLDCGPSAVLYAIADRIVDDYSEIAGQVESDIEDVEERVFSPVRTNDAARIYNLKREVIEFRRAVRPLIEPLTTLAEGGGKPHVHERLQPFFRDIVDHATRVAEQVEGFDDLLTSVLNANLAQVSVQQNEDMRRISAWVAIAAVPTMIAGIYGMNFEHMPELGWEYGYFLVLALMGSVCALMYRAFRRSGWL